MYIYVYIYIYITFCALKFFPMSQSTYVYAIFDVHTRIHTYTYAWTCTRELVPSSAIRACIRRTYMQTCIHTRAYAHGLHRFVPWCDTHTYIFIHTHTHTTHISAWWWRCERVHVHTGYTDSFPDLPSVIYHPCVFTPYLASLSSSSAGSVVFTPLACIYIWEMSINKYMHVFVHTCTPLWQDLLRSRPWPVYIYMRNVN
jgi:hypothetical protein